MKFVNKFSDVLDAVAKWIAIISTAVMWLVMCYAVIMRYVFRDAPVWGDELCRFSLVWLTFYGGSVALRKRALANMTLLVNVFPPRIRKWINVAVGICCVVLLVFFTKWSLQLVLSKSIMIQKSPAMGAPLAAIYSCMPIGLGLMTIQQIILVIRDIFPELPSAQEVPPKLEIEEGHEA